MVGFCSQITFWMGRSDRHRAAAPGFQIVRSRFIAPPVRFLIVNFFQVGAHFARAIAVDSQRGILSTTNQPSYCWPLSDRMTAGMLTNTFPQPREDEWLERGVKLLQPASREATQNCPRRRPFEVDVPPSPVCFQHPKIASSFVRGPQSSTSPPALDRSREQLRRGRPRPT